MSAHAPTTQQRRDHLTALPSVSCHLSTLPNAKGLDQVKLHTPTLAGSNLPAQEAKLRKALSVTSANSNNHQQVPLPPKISSPQNSPTCSQPPLMMRTTKSKLR